MVIVHSKTISARNLTNIIDLRLVAIWKVKKRVYKYEYIDFNLRETTHLERPCANRVLDAQKLRRRHVHKTKLNQASCT